MTILLTGVSQFWVKKWISFFTHGLPQCDRAGEEQEGEENCLTIQGFDMRLRIFLGNFRDLLLIFYDFKLLTLYGENDS